MDPEQRRARMREIRTRLEGLAAHHELTRTQEGEFFTLSAEFDRLEREETLDRVRTAGQPGSRLGIEGPPEDQPHRARLDGERGRALDVLDRIERADTITTRAGLDLVARLVEGQEGDEVARHVQITGSEAYRSAFLKFTRDPELGYQDFDADERAAWTRAKEYVRASLTTGLGTGGGYLIPLSMETQIQLSNVGTSNADLRSAFTVRTISGTTWQGPVSVGVTAEWSAENAQSADASPTITGPQIGTNRADAWITASYESIQDAPMLESEVAKMITDAKTRLEAAAFVKGSGTGQPKGIITAAVAAAKTVATGTADVLNLADLYATKGAVPPRWRGEGSWLISDIALDRVRRLGENLTGSAGQLSESLAADTPSRMLGRAIYETSELDAPGATVGAGNDNIAVFGGLRAYFVVDRIGMMVRFIPDVMGANGRPLGQSGWFGFWRVGGDLVVPDAVRVLRA